ncbi:hypothetical protein [Deinococcus sp. 6GRE01]|uniref:hypothetical protein n=1 Tax=Deinococcus sp. 6GRE01 TaxID=2745873 RepID=UPI001E34D3AB|nr:hypothetical protein [Deinococcus sp. 6GRE01]MCD0155862.1 hypothetical protein [Deinococcus sp. 6GRE01]
MLKILVAALATLALSVLSGVIVELVKEQGGKLAISWLNLIGKIVGPKLRTQYVEPQIGELSIMDAGNVSKMFYALHVSLSMIKIVWQREIDNVPPIATALYFLSVALLFWPSAPMLALTCGLAIGFICAVVGMVLKYYRRVATWSVPILISIALIYQSIVLLANNHQIEDGYIRLLGVFMIALTYLVRLFGLLPLEAASTTRQIQLVKQQMYYMRNATASIEMQNKLLERLHQERTQDQKSRVNN